MSPAPPAGPARPPGRSSAVSEAIASLYGERPTLDGWPAVALPLLRKLAGANVAGYGELNQLTGATRGTIDPMLPNWDQMHLGYYRHMGSHPFWQIAPTFFADGPKRAEDVFGKGGLTRLPMYSDALAKVGATDVMIFAFVFARVRIGFGLYRLGGKPFSVLDRNRLAAFQPHVEQSYELAWRRTLKTLPLVERIALLHPQTTERQREVLACLALGKDNATIARLLDIEVETVKVHLKAAFAALHVESRLEAALVLLDSDRLHLPMAHMTVGFEGRASKGKGQG